MNSSTVEAYFDTLVEASPESNVDCRSYPRASVREHTEDSVTIEHLIHLPAFEKKRRVYTIFDIFEWDGPELVEDGQAPVYPNVDFTQHAADITTHGVKKCMELPEGLKPASALPAGAAMSIVVCSPHDGRKRWVVKHIAFKQPVAASAAEALLVGSGKLVPYRANTAGMKKAAYMLLNQLDGTRMLYFNVVAKADSQSQRSAAPALARGSSKWDNLSVDEIYEGMEYINKHAKNLTDGNNARYQWVLTKIRDPESPICGWPEVKVEKAINNLQKFKAMADAEVFFPLNIMDLKPTWCNQILPLIVPLLASFGLFILGAAGVGKTQLAKILAMAFGRWRSTKVEDASMMVLGWRRGSSIDVFRETPGTLLEAILFDDPVPGIDCLSVELLKSFLDVGENTLCDARYTPAKFVRNQLRVLLCNNWDATAEPQALMQCNDEQTFMKMIQPAIGYVPHAHKMAVLKRSVTIVAGARGVYVRLPSEHVGQPIHVFRDDDVAADWLKSEHKAALNDYREGREVKYDGFVQNVEREQALMEQWMSSPGGASAEMMCEERWRQEWELTQEEALAKENADLRAKIDELVRANQDLQRQLAEVQPVRRRLRRKTECASQQTSRGSAGFDDPDDCFSGQEEV